MCHESRKTSIGQLIYLSCHMKVRSTSKLSSNKFVTKSHTTLLLLLLLLFSLWRDERRKNLARSTIFHGGLGIGDTSTTRDGRPFRHGREGPSEDFDGRVWTVHTEDLKRGPQDRGPDPEDPQNVGPTGKTCENRTSHGPH